MVICADRRKNARDKRNPQKLTLAVLESVCRRVLRLLIVGTCGESCREFSFFEWVDLIRSLWNPSTFYMISNWNTKQILPKMLYNEEQLLFVLWTECFLWISFWGVIGNEWMISGCKTGASPNSNRKKHPPVNEQKPTCEKCLHLHCRIRGPLPWNHWTQTAHLVVTNPTPTTIVFHCTYTVVKEEPKANFCKSSCKQLYWTNRLSPEKIKILVLHPKKFFDTKMASYHFQSATGQN